MRRSVALRKMRLRQLCIEAVSFGMEVFDGMCREGEMIYLR